MPPSQPDRVAEDLLGRLSESPDAYPHKIDLVGLVVLFVRLGARAYRSASFLDDRVLGPDSQGIWTAFSGVVDALRSAPPGLPVHFIFHTGHVGSTLVSRLLDETGEVLSLREPLPLRTLAEAHDALARVDSLLSHADFASMLAVLLRLWGRGYDGTSSVVVKATSSVGRIASALLRLDERSRAIYISLPPEPYLAALLAGANSGVDLRGHGPERMRRLQSRLSVPLPPLHKLSAGEMAAMSWLAESWSRYEALTQCSSRIAGVDFDQFLADVEPGIGRILEHFGLPHGAALLSNLGRSPVLTRYSKAPEYAYTPALRAEVLRESRRINGEEIRRGMRWLERQARADARVSRLLNEGG
ncbi:MAG TPA: hypothetical protein VL742_21000 [Casimicrobiaceae bacterium]|nr:hypothetical protein [Casimicrobiaceae bacterium]